MRMLCKSMERCAPEFRPGPHLSLRAEVPSLPQGRRDAACPLLPAASASKKHAGSGEHGGCFGEPLCAGARPSLSLGGRSSPARSNVGIRQSRIGEGSDFQGCRLVGLLETAIRAGGRAANLGDRCPRPCQVADLSSALNDVERHIRTLWRWCSTSCGATRSRTWLVHPSEPLGAAVVACVCPPTLLYATTDHQINRHGADHVRA